jgi:hypothetical protein
MASAEAGYAGLYRRDHGQGAPAAPTAAYVVSHRVMSHRLGAVV